MMKFLFYDCVDSTNRLAMEMARDGAEHGTCLIANRQNQGRGRLGRSFSSPEGGLYLSMILRPEQYCSAQNRSPLEATSITTRTAVVVCRAIEELLKKQEVPVEKMEDAATDIRKMQSPVQDAPKIKWVNDIYMHGRKICGILVQSIAGSNGIEAMIVGIGVNVCTRPEDFPSELAGIVSSIFPGPNKAVFTPAELGKTIARRLLHSLETEEQKDYMEEYRKRCFLMGKKVSFQSPDHQTTWRLSGRVEGIRDDGALLVRMEDGCLRELFTGEVSIKQMDE